MGGSNILSLLKYRATHEKDRYFGFGEQLPDNAQTFE
jgi:hypothetical protein